MLIYSSYNNKKDLKNIHIPISSYKIRYRVINFIQLRALILSEPAPLLLPFPHICKICQCNFKTIFFSIVN